MNLTPVQQQIVDTPGNLIVRASAGTGKTHTMVAKIATEIEHNHTHKSIAAITFTIKAAQEIKDRLTIDSSRHFIGTNNSFVIEEIIKPFLKDVYGAEFEVDTIKRTLEAIANAENQTVFDTTVNSLCDYLGYETRPEHLNKLFSTVSNKKYHVAFNTDIYQNIAITFHSSKGLEFDQVILFAGDYNLSDMSGIYNHYVAVTRAKEKVVIVKCSDYYANRFESNLSQIFALSGLKTCNLVTYK